MNIRQKHRSAFPFPALKMSGRMSFHEYQSARGIVCTIGFLFAIVSRIVIDMMLRWYGENNTGNFIIFCLSPLAIYLLLLLISISVRRLHDIGLSGLWVLNPVFFIYKFLMGIDAEEGEPGRNAWGANPTEASVAPEEDIRPCPPDMRELYVKAARKNDPEACCELSKRYFAGSGVIKSPLLALRWLVKAANAGHAGAIRYVSSLSTPTTDERNT